MSDPTPPPPDSPPPHVHPKDRGPVRAVPTPSTHEPKLQIPLDAAPTLTSASAPSNVVFLRHAVPTLTEYSTSILSCMNCGNKTYTLRRVSSTTFPVLQCAACQQAVGRVGWAPDEPEDDG